MEIQISNKSVSVLVHTLLHTYSTIQKHTSAEKFTHFCTFIPAGIQYFLYTFSMCLCAQVQYCGKDKHIDIEMVS